MPLPRLVSVCALPVLLACEPGVKGSAPPAASLPPDPVTAPVRDTGIPMAITVDDLPGDPTALRTMIAAFQRHGTGPVYGFINGQQLENNPEGRKALEAWVAAGHRVGNHTYSHAHMKDIGVEAFIEGIRQNEAVLAELAGPDADPSTWKVFRYPFLEQGFDAASTAAVREHLAADGYRVAEVSIDFGDWAFDSAYQRCREMGNAGAIEALRETFLRTAGVWLGWAEEAGHRVFGEPIPHVLLIHGRAFTGERIEELLNLYEEKGVAWVPLEQAMDHPVYRDHRPPDSSHGDSILEQAIVLRDADHPPWVQQPLALLHAMCTPAGP